MIKVEVINSYLVLKYYADFGPDWIQKELNEDNEVSISGVFTFNSELLIDKNLEDDFDNPEYCFKIGELQGDYYEIDKEVFGVKNKFHFHRSLNINDHYFVAKNRISILYQIDKLVNQDVFIGGENESILPIQEFERLIKLFPNSHEIKLYRYARISSILKDYFDGMKDWETNYNSYLNKKIPVSKNNNLRKIFKDSDILKYQSLRDKLKYMLDNEVKYTEHQWQQEILQIILLIFPKYIFAFPELAFEDLYTKKKRRLDFGLIDFMGNLDILEIKTPFDNSIVSTNYYRENHIPNRALSGTIMQIEKYIFYLNKLGKKGERRITEKYKDQLPDGMQIKITNPNGIIILGRDKDLSPDQLFDFEIIKRKYKNIIEIFTYDDMIRRLDMILTQLSKL